MTIKLITFDLDDTLWDTAPVIVSAEAVLRQWLTDHAPQLGGVPVEHLWTIRERVLNNEPGLKYRISALRRRVLFHALEEAGYDQGQANALADQSFEVFLHARHQLDIFPEVQPTLEALANHFALGVVTNGNADVRRLGLADYFKFALCAEDIGIAKPDARLFHEALQRGEATPDTAVHIGDHPGDDIAGAQQAGLRAIWFNPAGKAWEADRLPDAEIRSLTELPKLLARWHNGA
ncbi:HAD family hydrolase [Pseudomonas chlororaphis]|uniref:HAD family hydrolase n=1 Tax=Pseudomonas chlororaphis TaxID=587753 RepID=UPI0006A5C1AC|nr:HAD-IA family hydrolase [Pseudomonas chlororaphis]AZD05205.1 2-haloalkanoic acid dehalogenase [Pseudomonas chlororaphis subsp. chlororaphis]MBM0283705.1 HAD-IA family hydrolase [Pseudomonas chlororaphis]MDO1507474.1 HAD-IA family hydrolase [Pseudomonas chlororaphis]ORM47492.1 HAD family hydrolase [Pseudomonas chlororaphis subsp. chlororaphis]TWR90426.1 HAD-IA family hydrolase [Pseudomonas chlororaphis subsp. chlororaphis]